MTYSSMETCEGRPEKRLVTGSPLNRTDAGDFSGFVNFADAPLKKNMR